MSKAPPHIATDPGSKDQTMMGQPNAAEPTMSVFSILSPIAAPQTMTSSVLRAPTELLPLPTAAPASMQAGEPIRPPPEPPAPTAQLPGSTVKASAAQPPAANAKVPAPSPAGKPRSPGALQAPKVSSPAKHDVSGKAPERRSLPVIQAGKNRPEDGKGVLTQGAPGNPLPSAAVKPTAQKGSSRSRSRSSSRSQTPRSRSPRRSRSRSGSRSSSGEAHRGASSNASKRSRRGPTQSGGRQSRSKRRRRSPSSSSSSSSGSPSSSPTPLRGPGNAGPSLNSSSENSSRSEAGSAKGRGDDGRQKRKRRRSGADRRRAKRARTTSSAAPPQQPIHPSSLPQTSLHYAAPSIAQHQAYFAHPQEQQMMWAYVQTPHGVQLHPVSQQQFPPAQSFPAGQYSSAPPKRPPQLSIRRQTDSRGNEGNRGVQTNEGGRASQTNQGPRGGEPQDGAPSDDARARDRQDGGVRFPMPARARLSNNPSSANGDEQPSQSAPEQCRVCGIEVQNVGKHLSTAHFKCRSCARWLRDRSAFEQHHLRCTYCPHAICPTQFPKHVRDLHPGMPIAVPQPSPSQQTTPQQSPIPHQRAAPVRVTYQPAPASLTSASPNKGFVTIKCPAHRGVTMSRDELRACDHCSVRPIAAFP